MVSLAEIARAAELIRAGGLVAFPTETVYGLGANALNPEAINRIYEAKGRPATSPLIVHVHSVELAMQLSSRWPETAKILTQAFWPGPLTLVVPKHRGIPANVTAGLETVGLRMPAHPVAHAMLRAAGVPVAAPSANRFTELSPTTAQHVRDSLGDRVDMILDGGATEVGIESTVVSLVGARPAILRPGMVSELQLEAVIGPVDVISAAEGAHPSPGMHQRHYSPRTPVRLMHGTGLRIFGRGPDGNGRTVAMPGVPDTYAARLYAVLHDLDAENWVLIEIEVPPDTPEWAGILDRLRRAATSS